MLFTLFCGFHVTYFINVCQVCTVQREPVATKQIPFFLTLPYHVPEECTAAESTL